MANPFSFLEEEEKREPSLDLPQLETIEAPEIPEVPKWDAEQARKDRIAEILGEKYSDEARDTMLEKTKSPGLAEGIGTAIAGVGDAISRGYGRQNTNFMKDTMARGQAKRSREREDFEKGKKGTLDQYFLNKKLDVELGREDLNGPATQIAQSLMEKLDPEGDWSGYTAAQLEPYLGKYQKIYEGKLKAEANKISRDNANYWKSLRQDERSDKQAYKEQQDAAKKVDFSINALSGLKRAGASGQFQMSNKRVLLSEDAARVIKALRDGKLSKDETIEAELAAQIASTMMGGNQPSHETIKHFMSPTAQKTAAGIFKYATGKPQDAMTDAIVDHFGHQVEMQIKYWKERRNQVTNGQYVKLEPVFQKYPEERVRFEKWASTMFGKGGGKNPNYLRNPYGGTQPDGSPGGGGGHGEGGGFLHVPARKVQKWIKDKDGNTVALVKTPEGWLEVKPTGMDNFEPDFEPKGYGSLQ